MAKSPVRTDAPIEDSAAGTRETALTRVVSDLAVKAGVGIGVAAISNPFVGAVVGLGPDIGRSLYTILRDFVARPESPRRSSRALLATQVIMKGISARLENGDAPRDDNFFCAEVDRSRADELYEAVLEACIKQFEEKKIPHLAKIYENAIFMRTPAATVNSLLQQASEKTWRHFCLLSLLADEKSAGIVSEFFGLMSDSLAAVDDAPHLHADLERLHGRATGLISDADGKLALSRDGQLFVAVANLRSIQDAEIETIKETMRRAVALGGCEVLTGDAETR